MKGTKHKIFILAEPLEDGMFKCFLFQSGDIGDKRGNCQSLARLPQHSLLSASSPELRKNDIFVNGEELDLDFRISSGIENFTFFTKSELDKLKELEYAYNNR